MEMKSSIVATAITRLFGCLGRRVAKTPGYFIIFPLFISAILCTSLPSANFISNADYLYTVIGSTSKINREYIERTFPYNVSADFDLRRSTRSPRGVWLIATALDQDTVLKKNIFKELAEADKIVQKVSIKVSKKKYRYNDLCAKINKECYHNSILSLLPRMRAVEERRRKLRYPIDSKDLITGAHLGGVVTENDGYIRSAKAVLLSYFLNMSNPYQKQKAALWEEEVIRKLSIKPFSNISLSKISSSSFENQLHEVIIDVLKLCIPLVITMIILAVLTSVTTNCSQSMPLCAALGCLSSGLAVLSAFGIIIYISGDVADVCMSVPFLTLGVGMDDTFVMLAAWRRTDPRKSVEERLEETYSESAVSITITSLTNFITFCIGLAASYHAIRLFCLYATISVLFTYIYQATFFGACLAINAYYDCYCVYQLDRRFKQKETTYIPKKLENRDHIVALLFRNKIAPCLTTKVAKTIIFTTFFIYLGFSIWGSIKLEKSVDNVNCLPSNSYVVQFYNDYNKYFIRYRETLQVVIDKPVNYSDVKIQQEIEELITKLENTDYISGSLLTESWLKSYLHFLLMGHHYIKLLGYDVTKKQDFIDVLRKIFLPMPETNRFSKDLIFDLNYTEILSSRILLQTNLTGTSEREGKMVEQARHIASSSNISSFVFGPMFVHHEQYLTVDKATIRITCITAAVVMFVFFLFLPNFICILSVGFLISSIEIGTIGFMTFANVKLDALCMLNIMLCIGYSIDYAAHMTHFYVYSKQTTATGRIRDALYSAGLPILQCSLSTLVGVFVLSFAPARIFHIFVKLVVLVIVLSTIHSLFILPLLLSICDCNVKPSPKKTTMECVKYEKNVKYNCDRELM